MYIYFNTSLGLCKPNILCTCKFLWHETKWQTGLAITHTRTSPSSDNSRDIEKVIEESRGTCRSKRMWERKEFMWKVKQERKERKGGKKEYTHIHLSAIGYPHCTLYMQPYSVPLSWVRLSWTCRSTGHSCSLRELQLYPIRGREGMGKGESEGWRETGREGERVLLTDWIKWFFSTYIYSSRNRTTWCPMFFHDVHVIH